MQKENKSKNRKKLKAAVAAILFFMSATLVSISSATVTITGKGITTTNNDFKLDFVNNSINISTLYVSELYGNSSTEKLNFTGDFHVSGYVNIGLGNPTETINGILVGAGLLSDVDNDATYGNIAVTRFEDTLAGVGAYIYGGRTRGDPIGGRTIVQDGDTLFDLIAIGWDGADYATAARITFGIDGEPSINNMPGAIIFKTSSNGSQNTLPRMIINSSGYVGINNTNPAYEFDVTGDIHCTGKLTSDGGNDPPYILFNKENLFDIINRINKEVPQDKDYKWDGQAIFYDGIEDNMFLLNPESGEIREFVWKSDYDILELRIEQLEIQMQELLG